MSEGLDPEFFGNTWKPKAPILIEGYSTNFYDNAEFNKYADEWAKNFVYRIGMTDSSTGSDFTRYLAMIKAGTSTFSITMKQLLGL